MRSKNRLMERRQVQQASNGCNKIQTMASTRARGHMHNTNSMSQQMEMQQLLAMVVGEVLLSLLVVVVLWKQHGRDDKLVRICGGFYKDWQKVASDNRHRQCRQNRIELSLRYVQYYDTLPVLSNRHIITRSMIDDANNGSLVP
jgi:hypothetical protein